MRSYFTSQSRTMTTKKWLLLQLPSNKSDWTEEKTLKLEYMNIYFLLNHKPLYKHAYSYIYLLAFQDTLNFCGMSIKVCLSSLYLIRWIYVFSSCMGLTTIFGQMTVW